MWELIDWNGKAENKKDILIQDNDADAYFRNIFQSKSTFGHPTIADVTDQLDTYNTFIPLMDDIPQKAELYKALKKVGKGCGIDGIPSAVIRLLPHNILDNILTLLQNSFTGDYPTMWEKQILNALPKDGHTPK